MKRDLGDPILLDARDVARLLRVGRSRAYAIMRQLPHVSGLGRSERVPREALEAWVRDNTAPTNVERPFLVREKGRSMERNDAENEAKATTAG